ncbi:rifin [Plasmodium sp. gorilla clade G1]|nr:rifin [Plasmodium sp. gorilla clade G1]
MKKYANINNQKNHYITAHTPTNKLTKPHRLLCECDLYQSPNYNNDTEMKKAMEIFDQQTSQRFHEYDERIIKKRQKCKDQCDKDIQQIILKDKIEKELTETFATLQTDITTKDIPKCVCQKSLADKVEKICLKCGKNLGAGVPGLGILGAYVVHSMTKVAMVSATNEAMVRATAAGVVKGMQATIEALESIPGLDKLIGYDWFVIVNTQNFNKATPLIKAVTAVKNTKCASGLNPQSVFCSAVDSSGSQFYNSLVREAANSGMQNSLHTTKEVTPGFIIQEVGKVTSANAILSNPIVIAFIVIVILIVTLLIIYLILRYRRKKKMKKKIQYIKLLKE